MRRGITPSFTRLIASIGALSVIAAIAVSCGFPDFGGFGATGGSGGGTSVASSTASSSASSTASTSSSSGGGSGGSANPCEGVVCDMPPANQCNGSNLVVYASVGTCDAGSCTYNTTSQACTNGCASGMCNGDPCAGVTCNQAAASYCVDTSHLRVRDLPGTCSDGSCTYTTHDEFCAFDCANGACNGDPCVGVVCPPKANECADPNTLVQYDAGKCTSGLPCTYGSTNVTCPTGCVNGQCVMCTTSSQCPSGNWCSNNQCVSCNSDLHCGASCVACGGATPKCNGTTCVQCLTDGDCAGGMVCGPASTCITPGCAPPTAACTSSGDRDGGCASAYIIDRTIAGTTSGFSEPNDYGLCDRNNNFTDNTCGGGSGSDAEYKLFMRKNEVANIQLTRGSQTCTGSWAGALSLKIFEAACDTSCNCSKTTCPTQVYCMQGNSQNPMFVAPSDGWYTIVVDSAGPAGDIGGVFYLGVKLTCTGGSCACM